MPLHNTDMSASVVDDDLEFPDKHEYDFDDNTDHSMW